MLPRSSLTLIVALVEADVRRLTPSQAGANDVPDRGEAGGAEAEAGDTADELVDEALAAPPAAVPRGAVPPATASTPVAAYRVATPKSARTACPLTWVTVYQDEPDFQVGQLVRHGSTRSRCPRRDLARESELDLDGRAR